MHAVRVIPLLDSDKRYMIHPACDLQFRQQTKIAGAELLDGRRPVRSTMMHEVLYNGLPLMCFTASKGEKVGQSACDSRHRTVLADASVAAT